MQITIRLTGLQFHAPIGWYPEEHILGNTIVVDIELSVEVKHLEEDELQHTVNYEQVYDKVKAIVMQPAKLLETVANHIAKNILADFKHVNEVKVSVAKLNPPLGGKVEKVAVEVSKKK